MQKARGKDPNGLVPLGNQIRGLMLNLDRVVKIEPTNRDDTDPRSPPLSIVTLDSGEELVVLGTPEDLLTHEQYLYRTEPRGEARTTRQQPDDGLPSPSDRVAQDGQRPT
jgi:hypothetical protein